MDLIYQTIANDVKMPTYNKETDAGMDLYAYLPRGGVMLAPGETVAIGTGLKFGIPEGWALLILPKSGISLKTGLRVANSPGLIDCGYKDEIKVIITNTAVTQTPTPSPLAIIPSGGKLSMQYIQNGDPIAQMLPIQVEKIRFVEGDIMTTSEDRGGGLGSSDATEFSRNGIPEGTVVWSSEDKVLQEV